MKPSCEPGSALVAHFWWPSIVLPWAVNRRKKVPTYPPCRRRIIVCRRFAMPLVFEICRRILKRRESTMASGRSDNVHVSTPGASIGADIARGAVSTLQRSVVS